jgi:hypothetical protein
MKNYTVRRYSSEYFELWNAFISTAKNATFLFHRDFMEYHADRFQDFSLLVFEGEKLVSVIPANREGDTVFSHQGLTYGGFVFYDDLVTFEIDLIIAEVILYLKENQIKEFSIKEIVSIYLNERKMETQQSLVKNGAELVEAKMNLAIDFNSNFKVSKSKLKHYNRIKSIGLSIRNEENLTDFWNKVLCPRLEQKFNVKPVHSLKEIIGLKNKFPENIYQYSVYKDEEILAGITVFKTNTVIKSQYGATTEKGEKYRALDYLYITLIDKYKSQLDFFDMGTVNDNSELGYNFGLLNQKKELGCDLFEQKYFKIVI